MKIESTSKTVPFGLLEWNLKRQILYWSIVYYESAYRNKKTSFRNSFTMSWLFERFDRVKSYKLFEILKSNNIPNLLLKHITEIYSGNESKYKQLINRRTYN